MHISPLAQKPINQYLTQIANTHNLESARTSHEFIQKSWQDPDEITSVQLDCSLHWDLTAPMMQQGHNRNSSGNRSVRLWDSHMECARL